MGVSSITNWLIVIIVLGVPKLLWIPTVRKAGFSAWWIALSFIPIASIVLLWIFAYAKWPAEPER